MFLKHCYSFKSHAATDFNSPDDFGRKSYVDFYFYSKYMFNGLTMDNFKTVL